MTRPVATRLWLIAGEATEGAASRRLRSSGAGAHMKLGLCADPYRIGHERSESVPS